jgi:predicted nuclease with RNAse H fold
VTLVVGVDLSGPSNAADTAVACFLPRRRGPTLIGCRLGASDQEIVEFIASKRGAEDLVVGLDAPLSYEPGGGDRPSDKALRSQLVSAGLKPGSVMPPTLTRMAYLTLRGVVVARLLAQSFPGVRIVEVHPGGAMVLRGAPAADVVNLKRHVNSRRSLVSWLANQGLLTESAEVPSDHEVAAYACALAAWDWSRGRPAWRAEAASPVHPFDFVC